MAKADIDYELTVIQNREKGEDVRDAIVESIKKIKNMVPDALVGLGKDKVDGICSGR